MLGLIRDSAGRVEVLKGLLAAELASPERSAHRCVEVAAEIRQAEAQMARLVASLDPEMVMEAKSLAASDRCPGAVEQGRCRWAFVKAFRTLNRS